MKSSCPHCGQHFDVDEADVGKEADCINCGKRFQIEAVVPTDSAASANGADPPFFDEKTKGCVLKVFLWTRKIVSVICVVAAMYQMYDIRNDLKDSLKYEDSAIRAISKKTRVLVDLMEPLMLMLLAIFIKPGGKSEE